MEAHHIVQKPYPKGGCMDEVSAQATLTDAEVDPRLAVSVPKSEIERVLEAKDDVDLLLDVIRTNGEREERRVSLAWDRDALERLAQQEGERVIIAIDPDSLQAAFDDVEGHGMREMGATLAIVVAAAAGGAGAAGAVISPTSGSPSGSPAVEATVDTSAWQAEAEASGYGVRRATWLPTRRRESRTSAQGRRHPKGRPIQRPGSRTSGRGGRHRQRRLTPRLRSRTSAAAGQPYPIPRRGLRTSAPSAQHPAWVVVAEPPSPLPAR